MRAIIVNKKENKIRWPFSWEAWILRRIMNQIPYNSKETNSQILKAYSSKAIIKADFNNYRVSKMIRVQEMDQAQSIFGEQAQTLRPFSATLLFLQTLPGLKIQSITMDWQLNLNNNRLEIKHRVALFINLYHHLTLALLI
jgi:hypothetical protein